jgi:ATP-dependent helicase Lhr and Lhr-like helicase
VTCDSFAGLRWLMVPAARRNGAALTAGRWSVLRRDAAGPPNVAEFAARQLLQRTGVVFRKTVARERLPVPWRDVARACRLLEARGEIRGGRFVHGFDGEQYALPEAITLLRSVRKRGPRPLGAPPVKVSAADPLNLQGILTPEDKVAPTSRQHVQLP